MGTDWGSRTIPERPAKSCEEEEEEEAIRIESGLAAYLHGFQIIEGLHYYLSFFLSFLMPQKER